MHRVLNFLWIKRWHVDQKVINNRFKQPCLLYIFIFFIFWFLTPSNSQKKTALAWVVFKMCIIIIILFMYHIFLPYFFCYVTVQCIVTCLFVWSAPGDALLQKYFIIIIYQLSSASANNFYYLNLLCSIIYDVELPNLEACAHTDIKILWSKFRCWLQVGQAIL